MSSVISNEFEIFLENNHLARKTADKKRVLLIEFHNFFVVLLLKGNAGGVSGGIGYL